MRFRILIILSCFLILGSASSGAVVLALLGGLFFFNRLETSVADSV